jgi:hypothetical protein
MLAKEGVSVREAGGGRRTGCTFCSCPRGRAAFESFSMIGDPRQENPGPALPRTGAAADPPTAVFAAHGSESLAALIDQWSFCACLAYANAMQSYTVYISFNLSSPLPQSPCFLTIGSPLMMTTGLLFRYATFSAAEAVCVTCDHITEPNRILRLMGPSGRRQGKELRLKPRSSSLAFSSHGLARLH